MRKIVITRPPALDRAIARFDAWWSGLSQRERVMLAGLAIVLGGLVLVFGVVKPLQAARAEALQDIRTYETLSARIRAAGGITPTPAARQRRGAPAEVIANSAGEFALAATTAPIPGGLRATIADGSYEALMTWLADLQRTSRLSVRRVEVKRGTAPGHVAATVDFAS